MVGRVNLAFSRRILTRGSEQGRMAALAHCSRCQEHSSELPPDPALNFYQQSAGGAARGGRCQHHRRRLATASW